MSGMDRSFRHSEEEKQKKCESFPDLDAKQNKGYSKGILEENESSQPSLRALLRRMEPTEVVNVALDSRNRVNQDQAIDPLWRDGTMASTERVVNLTNKYAPGFVGGLAGTPEMGKSFGQYLRANGYREFQSYQTLADLKSRRKASDKELTDFNNCQGGTGHSLYKLYKIIWQRNNFGDKFIEMVRNRYGKKYLSIVQDWLKTAPEPNGEGSSSQQQEAPSSYGEGSSSRQWEAPPSYAALPMTDLTPGLLARGQREIEELEKQIRDLNQGRQA